MPTTQDAFRERCISMRPGEIPGTSSWTEWAWVECEKYNNDIHLTGSVWAAGGGPTGISASFSSFVQEFVRPQGEWLGLTHIRVSVWRLKILQKEDLHSMRPGFLDSWPVSMFST